MKTRLPKKLIAGFAGLVVGAISLQAQPFITGEITFDGIAMLNGSLSSATAYTSIFASSGPGMGPVVTAGLGTYAGTVGQHATFTPFTFEGPGVPATPFELWSFVVGGTTTFRFEVTSITVHKDDADFLAVNGNGIAYVSGYQASLGTWSLTDTGVSPYFTFGGATAVVPEPSSATLLLVLGSLAVATRRFTNKS